MAKKNSVIGALDKISEYNKLGGRGSGDLADTCYICGISPSNLKQALYSDILELIGEDEERLAEYMQQTNDKIYFNNKLRAAQRQALKEYFNL